MNDPILLSSHTIPQSDGHVYMVTCIFFKEGHARSSDSRCWGFSFNEEEAIRWVMCNATDMFETGYYNHAVVEKVSAGLIPTAEEVAWFEASFTGYYEPGKVTRLDARPALSEPLFENFNWFEHGGVFKSIEKVTDVRPKQIDKAVDELIKSQKSLAKQVRTNMLIPLCNELNINFKNNYPIDSSKTWRFIDADSNIETVVSCRDDLYEEEWLTEPQAKKFIDLLHIMEIDINDINFGDLIESYMIESNG